MVQSPSLCLLVDRFFHSESLLRPASSHTYACMDLRALLLRTGVSVCAHLALTCRMSSEIQEPQGRQNWDQGETGKRFSKSSGKRGWAWTRARGKSAGELTVLYERKEGNWITHQEKRGRKRCKHVSVSHFLENKLRKIRNVYELKLYHEPTASYPLSLQYLEYRIRGQMNKNATFIY